MKFFDFSFYHSCKRGPLPYQSHCCPIKCVAAATFILFPKASRILQQSEMLRDSRGISPIPHLMQIIFILFFPIYFFYSIVNCRPVSSLADFQFLVDCSIACSVLIPFP